MIKVAAFDLDGTLISTKELHYEALNKCLSELAPEYVISHQDHLKYFDGLSTKIKIRKLVNVGLDFHLSEKIYQRKQEITHELLEIYNFTEDHTKTFNYLKKKNIKIAVCSNSIRSSIELILKKLNLYSLTNLILSNEDVNSPKPSPEMYNKCIEQFGILPEEMLIFEDNENGIRAGEQSNSFVRIVSDPSVISTRFIWQSIRFANSTLLKPNENIIKTFISKNGQNMLKVKCPVCKSIRWVGINNINTKTFSYQCKICSARKQYNPHKIDKSGYKLIPLFILSEEDRKIAIPMCNANKTVREHRLIMAKHLGRSLTKEEIVHHKNGIKSDNRIENLMLLTTKTHHCGNGDDYYQKWQESESKIQQLKKEIENLCLQKP